MKKLWITISFFVFLICVVCVFFFILYPIHDRKYIEGVCEKYQLDKALVFTVINIESHWDDKAVSRSGALGLMQVMPSTATEVASKIGITDFSVENLYNGRTNIEIGCFYLRYLLDEFDGDVNLTLCAYNAGPNKVREWQKNREFWNGEKLIKIPYKETEKYVKKAISNKNVYNFILQL